MQLIKEWQVDLSICGLFNEDLWETSDFLVGIVCLKLSSILMGVFCGLIRHQSRKLTQVDYNCYWSKLDTPISWHTQFDEIDQIFEIKRFVRFVVAARFVLWFFFFLVTTIPPNCSHYVSELFRDRSRVIKNAQLPGEKGNWGGVKISTTDKDFSTNRQLTQVNVC